MNEQIVTEELDDLSRPWKKCNIEAYAYHCQGKCVQKKKKTPKTKTDYLSPSPSDSAAISVLKSLGEEALKL